MADRIILSVGTKRGLFLLESGRSRGRWKISGPHLKGWAINHAMIDTRGTPRLHAAASSYTYASTTLSSRRSPTTHGPTLTGSADRAAYR